MFLNNNNIIFKKNKKLVKKYCEEINESNKEYSKYILKITIL